MIDYTKSFTVGIKAAVKAETNKSEIGDVFSDLNKQLDNITDGKVTINRVQLYKQTHALRITFMEPRKYYWAIAAENPKTENSSVKELAKWEMDRNGYPCKITLGNDEIYCEDKVALERGLSDILQDSIVGDVLQKLMRLPIQVKERDNNDERNV